MSDGINSVVLKGELCWPELKYTTTGKALFKAKVKISNTDNNGEEKSSYLRIVAWDNFAEYLNSLQRGSCVRISGRIQERSFQDNIGQKRNVTDIVVDGVELADGNVGENYFTLQGELVWPDFKQVGERQTSLFRSKVKIPYVRNDGTLGSSYVRITAWDEMADGLRSIREGDTVKVSGHIQDRSWTDPASGTKKIFTDAVVTNFTSAGA